MNQLTKQRIQATVLATVFASLPVAVFAQEQSQSAPQSQPPQAQEPGTSSQSGQQSTLPEKLQELVNTVSQTNMDIATLGFQALSRAQNEQIREFAKKSIKDSVDAQQELAQLANKNSFQVEMKGGESKKVEGQGAMFEKQYLQQVQQLQQKLAKQLEAEGNQIQNESLKKFITKQLNDTLKDVNEAQKLTQSVQKSAPAPIGEGPKGSQE